MRIVNELIIVLHKNSNTPVCLGIIKFVYCNPQNKFDCLDAILQYSGTIITFMHIKTIITKAALLSLLTLTGCESIGPQGIKSAHCEYNSAISMTADEQQLLNIVRLKYRDSINFIEVSNIVENRKFTTRFGGAKIGVGNHHGNTEITPMIHTELFQNPTITYTPLRGKDFTERMIAPIPVSVVFGLMQAGWDYETVFSLCVEQINNIDNAPTASGPTPLTKPEFEKFEQICSLMVELNRTRNLIWGLDNKTKQNVVLSFDSTKSNNLKQKQLKDLLSLDESTDTFEISSNYNYNNNKSINIRTRSLQEVLFFIAHSVQVPAADIEQGLVTITQDHNNKIFDWNNNLAGKLIHIQCSTEQKKPANAYVAVKYRNSWFYIADNDLRSKSTFMFVRNLFNLQSGNALSIAPALTISVNS